jgi:ATP-dependent exoDNAse (exonuclease V) beta subunit
MVLSTINKHSRDKNIRFYQRGHKYEILTDMRSKYMSVTTWIHSMFPKFDADKVIEKMMKGKNWVEGHKYWNMTPQQIKDSWNVNRDSVANAGTNLHERIENFMNNEVLEYPYNQKQLYENENENGNGNENGNDNKVVEWGYFLNFLKDNPDLRPYRTEWMIYHEDVKIAGSIDMVYENEDGTLEIYDWKRCKEITEGNHWSEMALHDTISHIPSSNFWHYALQLNTYKKILEEKYGKSVVKLCLVRLHPDASNYEVIEVPFLKDEIDNLFDEKRK